MKRDLGLLDEQRDEAAEDGAGEHTKARYHSVLYIALGPICVLLIITIIVVLLDDYKKEKQKKEERDLRRLQGEAQQKIERQL
ncbi:hypothetical protein OSTOST_21866 [Ostertagia ostertagi]